MNKINVLSAEIQNFIRVFESKSINRAARKNNLDPGNISRQLAKLEDSLGIKLFTRHKTGLEPSQEGAELFLAVSQLEKNFLKSLKDSKANTKPRIRIGFHPIIGFAHFSPEMILKIIDLDLHPVFTIASSTKLTDLIKQRRLDFALVHASVKFPGLVSKVLPSKNLVLCSKDGLNCELALVNSNMAAENFEEILPKDQATWLVDDYFLIAKMLNASEKLMGVIPENLLGFNPNLKVIKILPKAGQVNALSWPGSVGLELMKTLNSHI